MGVFDVFFICTNGTKSRKASHIYNTEKPRDTWKHSKTFQRLVSHEFQEYNMEFTSGQRDRLK